MLKLNSMDLTLKNLNPEQKKAVTFSEGPLLIVAGAGTGKTTVITQRLAFLIETKKAESQEILALTFTDKAATEMEERVDKLLPYGYVDLWVSTFHSFGERILREHALDLGLDSGFKLLSRVEQWLLIRQNLDSFDLDYYKPLGNPTRFVQALVEHFSRAKDENISPEEYLDFAKKNLKKSKGEVDKEEAERILEAAQAFQTYDHLMKEKGYFDFGDLIIKTLELFQKRKAILEKFRSQFKYILVDEFQDTNYAQYELLKLLSAPKNNITVVCDDDQSIYKFRGAAISNILEFKKDFPKSKEVVLIKNYRSRQNILDLAYKFIQLNNPNRLEHQLKNQGKGGKGKVLESKVSKKLMAQNKGEGIIRHLHTATQEEEVLEVLREILRLKKEKLDLTWNDFAILVRANNQADVFVNTLANQGIPYQFVAARGLYQKNEILDLISYLKMLDNYHESASLFRVLQIPVLKFPSPEIVKLINYTNRKRISLYETLEQNFRVPGLFEETKNRAKFLLDLIKKHTETAKTKSVTQVFFEILRDLGMMELLTKEESAENNEKIANINRFLKRIQNFEKAHTDKSLRAFIEELNLIVEIGEDPAPQAQEEGPEAVKIMTIHSAKGLEFSFVFVVNLVDKRFPSIERKEAIELPDELIKEIVPEGDMHLEEERRLFYVACTRAKEGLYFTSAEDYGGARKKRPSRFLQEIELPRKKEEKIKQKVLDFTLPETKIKKEFPFKLPEKLSFTQLKAFDTCPKQYKYAHLWRVPVKQKPVFSFGRSIHSSLREFYLQIQKGKIPSKAELLEIYEQNWIDDWYDTRQLMETRKKVGAKLLEEFYEKNKKEFKAPKFLEKGFNIKVGKFIVKGVIDRIDTINSEVEIIDYKTGRVPKTEKDLEMEQLWIYAIACEEVFKDKPKYLSYYYFDENKKFRVEFKKADVEKVKDWITTLGEKIEVSDFKATPSVHKCSHCDFREICEDRAV